MVTPNKVIEKIIEIINADSVNIGVSIAEEMSEDSEGNKLNPPCVYVFEMLDEDSDESTSAGVPLDIPIDIAALIFSDAFKTAGESAAQCYSIAQKILPQVTGMFQLLNTNSQLETVHLLARKRPLDLMSKAAAGSTLRINLYYKMDFAQ